MEFPYRIAGIPCQIEILRAEYVRPRADIKTWECEDDKGGWYLEWRVLDRKGYPATWLKNKITNEDIESEIIRRIS